MPKRYFFDQDSSSHWFLVPWDKKDKWVAWCELDEDNPESWDAPKWAMALGGGVQSISFEIPKYNDKTLIGPFD